ncbi:MAG: SAM-dependent methyltransferase [Burkholderiales bacterium]|nr:SAM-dependent methyltransferase [Burkholderiales bacterium]
MKTLLHVGCGPTRLQNLPIFLHSGWHELRYDIDASVGPDIVGTLQDMSLIEDGVIDAIYSSHNIEHVWGFEVPGVLSEFYRVLANKSFAVILCPDMQSVAEAVAEGALDKPLYISPAGPIAAVDIIYGHQAAIAAGNQYMAHKTAFTDVTLSRALLAAGFEGVAIARDLIYGLHALAFKGSWDDAELAGVVAGLMPSRGNCKGIQSFGSVSVR